MGTPSSAVRRLMKDLAEIAEQSDHAVSAKPLQDNIFVWHANLVGSEGTPYEGGIFHLRIEFPQNYPTKSPSVTIFTPIPHPHVVNDRICLNILSDYESYFAGQNYSDGWSPAYSVSTILLQLQAFIMDIAADELSGEQLSAMLRKIPGAVEQTKTFECSECSHTYKNPSPKVNPNFITNNIEYQSDDIFDDFYPFEEEFCYSDSDSCRLNVSFPMSSSCEYEMDNDEEIDTGLYSSSLPNSPTLPYIVSAASSLPKNSFFNPENNTLDSSQDEDTSTNQLSSQEEFHTKAEKVFICLHSKRNYTEDILGYGISVFISCKTGRIAKISNSIDYLSYTAFYKEGGRRSLTNEEFEFWLPLYINESHGNRASSVVEDSISLIIKGETGLFEPLMVLDVFPKLMNTMMLDILSNRIPASDKSLSGYLCFHRWMLYFVEKYPSLLEYVNGTVNNFIEDEKFRHKDVVPSLGEFLPLLSLSDKTWDDIVDAYVCENLDRNAFWVLRKRPAFFKGDEAAELDDGQIQTFFDCVALGKQLALFHVFFLQNIGRIKGLSLQEIEQQYDESYGLASQQKIKRLREFCKNLPSTCSWYEFFAGVGKPSPPNKEMSTLLKTAISNSLRRGYHQKETEKRKPCWKFRKLGSCKYGDDCKFAHITR